MSRPQSVTTVANFYFTSADLNDPNVQSLLNTGSVPPANLAAVKDVTKPLLARQGADGLAYSLLPDFLTKSSNKAAIMESLHSALANGATSGTAFDAMSDTTGHAATMATKKDFGAGAVENVRNPAFPLASVLSKWPTGMQLLPSALGAGLAAADDKRQFLTDNKPAIDAFNASVLSAPQAADWSFKGNYILLGDTLARCDDHAVTIRGDGRTQQILQLGSANAGDATQLWSFLHSPGEPNNVQIAALHAGGESNYDVDALKSRSGASVFEFLNESARLSRAGANGSTVDMDRNRTSLAVLRSCMGFPPALTDAWQPLAGTRSVDVDVRAVGAMAASGALPFESLPISHSSGAAISVDGRPFTVLDNTLGTPLARPGADRVDEEQAKLLRYTCSQDALSRIKREVAAYTATKLGAEWQDKSSSELMNSLLGDDASRLAIESIISAHVYDPISDQLSALIATIAKTPDDIPALQQHALDGFRATILVPLLTTGGDLRSEIQLQIVDQQVKTIDRTALDGRIASAAARATAAQAELTRLKALTPASEDQARAIADETAEREDTASQASEEQDRLNEQRADIDNIAETERQAQVLRESAKAGVAFCGECERARQQTTHAARGAP